MTMQRILFIDDEINILNALKRLLHHESFEIETTTSPEEALKMISQQDYAVVVSDQRMPGMEGTQLLAEVRRLSPDTVRILLTGYADTQAAISAINEGAVYRFLTKPWDDEDMRLTLRQAVGYYELVSENKRLEALTQEQNLELKDLNKNLEDKVVERTQQISLLNKALQKSFLSSIQVMAKLSELHSPIIGSHSKRVATLCKAVAQQLGRSGEELIEVEIAATLHDIGKIGVPVEILLKRDAFLKPAEQELLRRHVMLGESIIGMMANLNEVAVIVRHHHERFDGNGYPDKLRGEQIPLGSRIIAVVDAYDKAMNERAVFSTTTPEKVLRFLKERSLKEFDPAIVTAFTQYINEGNHANEDAIEVEINARDMMPGMVLSRDLKTMKGVLILPKDCEISKETMGQVQKFLEMEPVRGIFVYRRAPSFSSKNT